MTSTTTTKSAAKKPRRMAPEPKLQTAAIEASAKPTRNSENPSATTAADEARPLTKSAVVLGLLTRQQGATLDQLIEATGWLPHTTRAALTGLKKKGYEVTSAKADGVRTYRVTNKLDTALSEDCQATGRSDA